MKKFVVSLTGLLFAAALQAQYPSPGQQGPAPYPPGTYPGEYPPGSQQPGISLPSRGKKSKQKQQNEIARTLIAEGRTVTNDGKKLVIATDDGRTITMTLTAETKFTRTGGDIPAVKVIPRTTVHIEAAEDDESFLTATHVDLLKDAPPQTAAEARGQRGTPVSDEDMTRPTILHTPVDAPDRPVLRRGQPGGTRSSGDSDNGTQSAANKSPAKPAATQKAAQADGDFTIDTDSDQPKIVRTGDELVDRTKEWSLSFTNGLPNFVCQQDTARYVERSRSAGWEPVDVVTAKVVYEDGREQYKEITVGGKRTNKTMLELGGSTSTGEFASTLRSLFSEASRADFKLYQTTHVGENAASIYDFKVALRNSDWFITVGGQTLTPAYSGSVWIDKSTAQVRRIEMQADNIPKDFPLDSMEWAVDYDEVSLGTAKFLLPVHAENLGCWRGSPICTKNAIDFRDYHKYSGESTITFK